MPIQEASKPMYRKCSATLPPTVLTQSIPEVGRAVLPKHLQGQSQISVCPIYSEQQGSGANGWPNARARRTVRGYIVPAVLMRRKLRRHGGTRTNRFNGSSSPLICVAETAPRGPDSDERIMLPGLDESIDHFSVTINRVPTYYTARFHSCRYLSLPV